MWINRKEFDALKKRVEELERVQSYDTADTFTVYDPTYTSSPIYYWHGTPSQKISVKDAVQKILNHLNLKMEYVRGTPQSIELVKEKKA